MRSRKVLIYLALFAFMGALNDEEIVSEVFGK